MLNGRFDETDLGDILRSGMRWRAKNNGMIGESFLMWLSEILQVNGDVSHRILMRTMHPAWRLHRTVSSSDRSRRISCSTTTRA